MLTCIYNKSDQGVEYTSSSEVRSIPLLPFIRFDTPLYETSVSDTEYLPRTISSTTNQSTRQREARAMLLSSRARSSRAIADGVLDGSVSLYVSRPLDMSRPLDAQSVAISLFLDLSLPLGVPLSLDALSLDVALPLYVSVSLDVSFLWDRVSLDVPLSLDVSLSLGPVSLRVVLSVDSFSFDVYLFLDLSLPLGALPSGVSRSLSVSLPLVPRLPGDLTPWRTHIICGSLILCGCLVLWGTVVYPDSLVLKGSLGLIGFVSIVGSYVL